MSGPTTPSDALLDKALSDLPREIEPGRDLWPQIRAEIEATPSVSQSRKHNSFWQWRLAAGFLLMAMTSAATYLIMRHSEATRVVAMTANADNDAVVNEYLRARADLDRQFAERLAALPSATRAKLEGNLADLRRAENELVANINKNPSDPLLHDLLISTYQSEAQLLADVSALSQPSS